jgi:hypothetical protein
MENLFGKYFRLALVSLAFFELLSLIGYLEPLVGQLVFFAIVLATLFLSLEKLEYGVYIVLAELFVASKGYLFYLELNGLLVSLRIALFLILVSVWLAKIVVYYVQNKNFGSYFKIRQSNLFKWYLLIFVFLIWGIMNGFLQNNTFANVFFDANGWLYFFLVFVFFDTIISSEQTRNILQIFLASVLILCLKTFVLLFIFSHQMIETWSIYRWLRTAGLAEVSQMSATGFYRIFFQSQIYILIAFFVLLSYIFWRFKENFVWLKSTKTQLFIFNIFLLSAIIVSLSRSFWIGFLAGLVIFLTLIIFYQQAKFKEIIRLSIYCLGIAVFSLILIFLVVKFPYPPPAEVSLASMLSKRTTDLDEVAAQSRWNLLGPLWQAVKNDFLTGSGFGKTVTYQSQDPRQLSRSQSGLYTTYAFEWGYLDIWLKLGLLGLIAYLILIFKIWQTGWQKFKKQNDYNQEKKLIFGLLLGILIIAITSIFSPYLNHPLGIGYLLLISATLEII